MKKIALFLVMLSIYSTSHAGLFEYYLGEDTPSNFSSNADSIEVIEQYQAPKSTKTYNNSYYNNSYRQQDNFYTNLTYPRKSYYDALANKEGFYRYDVLERTLENNLERLEREADRIDDVKRDIKREVSRLKKYSGSYYRDVRRQLENRYDDIEDREREVEDLIDDAQDDLKKLKKNKNNRNNSYYYYDGYYQIYDDYYYKQESYRPSWVNPELNNRREGYIYIK